MTHLSLDEKSNLKTLVEQAEELNASIDAIKAQLKEVMDEVKDTGFDSKTFREVLKARKKDRKKREREEEIFELYMFALESEAA